MDGLHRQPTDPMSAADDDRERTQPRLRLTRRHFLAAGSVTGVAALLAACGGTSAPATTAPTANLSAPAPTSAPNTGATPAAAAATPVQVAAATPATAQTIGKLVLNTDPYPKYTGTPKDSDTLTIIRGGDDLSDLNPIALNSYSPYTFCYDPLVWIDEFTLDPKPWLATKWEISSDGKSYTYTLRNDIKWHDGTPMTADDVAFSMVLYRDDPASGVARFFPLMKQDPTVVDPTTVTFNLTDPSGDWILNASNQFIVQKKQFADYWNAGKGEKGAKTLEGYPYQQQMLVGTGAWKQTAYNPGASEPNIQYARNDSYFQNAPHFSKMIFKEVDQTQAQLTAWLNNETDLLWPVTATDVAQVQNQDGWLYSANAVAFMCAWINFKNPKANNPGFLNDKAVRQALSTGIDRKGYADAIFKGFVREMDIGSVAFPWAYDTQPQVQSPAYDQAKAQSMLQAAGYKTDSSGKLLDKSGKPVVLDAIMANTNQYPVDKIAVSVQEDFRKLGIDMTVEALEAGALKARWHDTFNWDLNFYSRILFAGFSDYSYYHSKWSPQATPQGQNRSSWSNPQADTLLDQIIREPDLTKQKDLLWQFQAIIADDMPAFWLGFPNDLILVKKNLLGYQPNAMWQYWDTWKIWRTS